MKVYNKLILYDLCHYIQLSERLLRAFWHVLVLDLSILGIHFKLAVDPLVFSVFYGFT